MAMKVGLDILLVALGGGLGALCRFGIGGLTHWIWGNGFPIGTLVANLLGCFLIGILIGCTDAESNQRVRLFVGVGFLGSLTTFSTFSAETTRQLQEGQLWQAGLNVVLQLVLGFAVLFFGIWVGQRLKST